MSYNKYCEFYNNLYFLEEGNRKSVLI